MKSFHADQFSFAWWAALTILVLIAATVVIAAEIVSYQLWVQGRFLLSIWLWLCGILVATAVASYLTDCTRKGAQ